MLVLNDLRDGTSLARSSSSQDMRVERSLMRDKNIAVFGIYPNRSDALAAVETTISFSGNAFSVTSARGRFNSPSG